MPMYSLCWRSWTYHNQKLKVLHVQQQICKACLHCSTRVCECPWTCYCFVFVTFCILCCLFFTWISYRDPCFQWEIENSLCNDYQNGLIAGSLCFELCENKDKSVVLSYCVDQTGDVSVFKWGGNIVKARIPEKNSDSSVPVYEDMSYESLVDVLDTYFSGILGNSDHSRLLEGTLQYADFNKDGQLTFGEVSSIWQLLQIHEFLILFLFQDNSVFPALNGTCGSLYSYEATYFQVLYEKNNTSYFSKVFPNSYRWSFPDFPKRAHIAIGLLEYIYTTMETENTRFYMCDLSPRNFGYTEYYEMKVSSMQGIISERVLNKTLKEMRCEEDVDCVYGDHCRSQCNRVTHFCDGIGKDFIPDLVQICIILQDYIVYNMPVKLKYVLSHLVADCVRLGKKIHLRDAAVVLVDVNVIHDRLTQILWDELKYAENPWLIKSTPKPVSVL